MSSYIKGLFHGLGTLLTGLKVTGAQFFTPKITRQYRKPGHAEEDVRPFLRLSDDAPRRRGRNKFASPAGCASRPAPTGPCLTTETVADPRTGKTKKRLVRYGDLGSCMFYHLCVNACPTGAIRYSTDFEHAVYTRERTKIKQLNKQ